MSASAGGRIPLNRARVLESAVAVADASGLEALSMRSLADTLGVVPMALYKHVANKDELIDGMIDVVVGEIAPPLTGIDWRVGVRTRILSARDALFTSARTPARDTAVDELSRGMLPLSPTVMVGREKDVGALKQWCRRLNECSTKRR